MNTEATPEEIDETLAVMSAVSDGPGITPVCQFMEVAQSLLPKPLSLLKVNVAEWARGSSQNENTSGRIIKTFKIFFMPPLSNNSMTWIKNLVHDQVALGVKFAAFDQLVSHV